MNFYGFCGNTMAETNINIRLKKFLATAFKEFQNNNYTTAIKILTKAHKLDSNNPEILYNLGVASCRIEQYVEAIDYFRRLLELRTKTVDILQVLRLISFSLLKLGLFDDALLYCMQGLDLHNDDTVLMHLSAYALDMAGKSEDAIEYYMKILEIDPENISAKNSLAYLLAKSGGDLTKATKLAVEALSVDPNNPAYLDTYGFVMYKTGDFSHANAYLAKAQSLDPTSKEIRYHLAMVKKAIGQK